ncbi:MAG: homoserine dehydrogenase [Ruminococcaceae bacterium]|nr:homoserine dehydrogenase [Oscillospiraceae bacterium]
MKYVAILGYGTVGRGVEEILRLNADEITRRTGEQLAVRSILVRRDFPDCPCRDKLVQDFALIESDPEISIVAECIGGVGPALDYVRRSLKAGKSVVTSNKELVATHGLELMALAEEKGVSFLFEASVGGGIPALRPMSLCLGGNRIHEVLGIINGTTNYILTDMRRNGTAFADSLAEAQRLGYAEADPTADIEGLDAGRKICILADLAFGKNVDPGDISVTGITGVAGEDVAAAGALGYRIKLLGRAVRSGESSAAAYVAPHLVPVEHGLAAVEGVTNAVVIRSDAVGEVVLQGPGAGKLPTGSAVVGDIIEAAQQGDKRRYLTWEAAPEGYLTDPDTLQSRWYIRCTASREAVAAALGDVEFAPVEDCAFLTESLSGQEMKKKSAPLGVVSALRVLG